MKNTVKTWCYNSNYISILVAGKSTPYDSMERYLTKSRYKLALECPTKLFYTKKEVYVDKKIDDEFLIGLAEGGFQVGELAKFYFEGGINIDSLDYETALRLTNDLLKLKSVVIYEPAFLFKNFFIRADILIKNGNSIQFIEVKAKSIDYEMDSFEGKDGLKSKWKPYLHDVAFQKYVIKNAFPSFKIESFLLLVDKTKVATVEGLNQMFFIFRKDGRVNVAAKSGLTKKELGQEILIKIGVDDILDKIYNGTDSKEKQEISFEERINYLAEKYQRDERIIEDLGSKCKKCEFKATEQEMSLGKKSGYKECWSLKGKFTNEDFVKPHILNIWNFRKKDEYILQGKYFKNGLTRIDFEPKKASKTVALGLSTVDRQELQVQKATSNDYTHYIDKENLKAIMSKWRYPLHFIDFETTSVAIPFNIGMHPYEQIAFQFSHHIVYEDGEIAHAGQWINTQPGLFPNFHFLRALKADLDRDEGTIFRYAAHENTILNKIHGQLLESSEADKEDLCSWIRTITKSSSTAVSAWEGKRNMVDLLDVVLKYYYHPATRGSNSLKDVLPAILKESKFLKEKYSQPIYGNKIASKNFKDHIWISTNEAGEISNPYDKLPAINDGMSNEILNQSITDDDAEISDGGAAMIAYARLQFTEMTGDERDRIVNALLRYCELDTFAMVMLWEAWQDWCE